MIAFTWVGSTAYNTFYRQLLYDPHTRMLHNETSTGTVRPLIDDEQVFDIAATVWIRADEEVEKAWGKGNPTSLEVGALEDPLFSDVIFRGLHLSDKQVKTDIKYRFPIAKL